MLCGFSTLQLVGQTLRKVFPPRSFRRNTKFSQRFHMNGEEEFDDNFPRTYILFTRTFPTSKDLDIRFTLNQNIETQLVHRQGDLLSALHVMVQKLREVIKEMSGSTQEILESSDRQAAKLREQNQRRKQERHLNASDKRLVYENR